MICDATVFQINLDVTKRKIYGQIEASLCEVRDFNDWVVVLQRRQRVMDKIEASASWNCKLNWNDLDI